MSGAGAGAGPPLLGLEDFSEAPPLEPLEPSLEPALVSASLWTVCALVVLLAETLGFLSPSPGVIRLKSFAVRLFCFGTGIASAILPRPA